MWRQLEESWLVRQASTGRKELASMVAICQDRWHWELSSVIPMIREWPSARLTFPTKPPVVFFFLWDFISLHVGVFLLGSLSYCWCSLNSPTSVYNFCPANILPAHSQQFKPSCTVSELSSGSLVHRQLNPWVVCQRRKLTAGTAEKEGYSSLLILKWYNFGALSVSAPYILGILSQS